MKNENYIELKKYLESQYSPATAAAYYREIEIYLSENPKAEMYRYADVIKWIGLLRKRYKSNKTIHRMVSSIKVYYQYLVDSGCREDNPSRSIRLKDKVQREIQIQNLFSTEELESLLDRKERYKGLETRNKVLMSLLVYQGLTVGELANLEVSDIDLEKGIIDVKRKERRSLPLRSNQVLLFYKYLSEVRVQILQAKGNSFIIGMSGNPMSEDDIGKHVKRSCKGKFGHRVVNAERIRQSVIANLLKENKSLRHVQWFAGHKYTSSTEKYKESHLDRLVKAVSLYHPVK